MTEQLRIEAGTPTPRAKLLDLSLTQLVAGSLAAATAAALGSRLGVVGTITGAAVGSVISAVAASIYVTSMTRARHVLKWQKLHARPRQSTVQEVPPLPSRSTVQEVPPQLGRRWLGSAAVVFAVATAFLLGIQLASGTDVTGTSIGTRPPAAQSDRSSRGLVAEPDPAPTGSPLPTETEPTPSEPAATEAAPPTGPAPAVSTPAQPAPTHTPTTPPQPADQTQPTTSPSPTAQPS